MRVIAGELGGRRLVAPRGLEGAPDLRPRPRGDLLRARDVEGTRVLDLYCGTGALGDRGDLARRRRGDTRRPRHRGRRSATSSLGLEDAIELIRADVALAGCRRGERGRASTSSSSTPPINSPTAWPELDTAYPACWPTGRGSSRAAPATRCASTPWSACASAVRGRRCLDLRRFG